MTSESLPNYFDYVQECKRRYEGQIEITAGLELDYLPGNNAYTDRLIEQWKDTLEDIVYSVHYLNGRDGIYCVDYTPDDFRTNLLSYYGTMQVVVDEYYNQVERAIEHASAFSGRVRIGNINLIEKFASVLPPIDESQIRERLTRLLPLLQRYNVGIDANTAGNRVATCGKAYVPDWFIAQCRKLDIPCVYGSDAHHPDHLGLGWEWFAGIPLS